MPTDQKIDYIEFHAEDFEAVQSFYEKVFQWSFVDYGPEYRSFSDGKLDGGFRRSAKKASYRDGSALVVIYAENLERTREKILANGGSLVVDIFSFPGGRRFHFADPHGNELAVWSDK